MDTGTYTVRPDAGSDCGRTTAMDTHESIHVPRFQHNENSTGLTQCLAGDESWLKSHKWT